MANRWNIQQQGSKRKRSNQGTRGTARTQPAASNPNKNTKSTDTNRNNSGRTAAAKPAAKAAPKQNKPSGVQKVQQKVTYFTNKNKPKQTTQQASLNRLARQKGAAQVITGKQTPLPPKRATRMDQTLNPLEQMKTDTVLGRSNWISRATVPSKPLTAEERRKKTQQTAQRSGFNARARKQTLSSYDQKLPQGKRFQIQQAKQRWDEAAAKGDRAGMEKAHKEAESLRFTAGYSGGAAGNQRIAPKLDQDSYNRLNSAGRLAMTQAQMTRDRAVTEDEIARADRRIEEILNAPGYRNNRLSAAETGKGWSYGPDGRRMWAGTKEQNREDAAQGAAGFRAVGEGIAGGLLYAGQAATRATRDKFERENIDKWIADEANYNQAKSRLEFIQDYKRQFGVVPDGYNEMQAQIDYNNAVQARAQLQRIRGDVDSLYFDPTVAERLGLPTTRDETLGERLLRQAAEDQAEATEGMNGVERFVTNALISTGQSVPGMALGLIPGVGPALGLGVLGAQAGGSRAYDLRQQGVTAEDAYRAGFISGGIEALTEKLPMEKFAQIIKGKSGKSALRNVLEQAGLEGSEEAVSYVGNYIADVAQQNPDAHFSVLELLENAGMGAIGGAVFGTVGSVLAPGHAVSPAGAQSEEIQEHARGAATQIEAVQDAETQIRTAAAQRLREDAQAYNEMVKAGVWSDAEQAMVKASLDQRYAEIAGQNAGQTSPAANQAPLTQVFEDGMQRNRGMAERAPAASVPTPLAANETPVSVNPVEQAEQMTAEALRATDAEMARRDAVAQLQAETPPITYERSGLPPTSFLGAAIDARRENRARAEAEAQVRRDQEIARQNRVAAEQQTTTTNGPAEISTTIRRNEQAQVQQPVSRLEGLASTFGESGAASLRTIGGKMVSGQGAFVRDFTDVYNQVLGGRSENQVSRPAGMSDANYFAAVTAAQNDRQTGWDLDILKASKAAGRNVNAGVDWRDQYVRQMDRKTARTVDGLAKALGVKVVFAEKGSILTAGGAAANAEITGNVVRIEKDNPNPVRMLIGHELTHRMQDVSPESYRAFRDYAMSVPGSMEALERTVSLYQKAGAFRAKDNARQMAMDEVAADFAGSLLENSEQLQEFIRRNYENRTMLEVIRDFFRDLAAKLTGRQKAQADEAVRLLEEAIKGASARVKGMERMTVADEALELSDVNTLYSIRKEDPPKKTGVAYKVFFAKNGQLYPPMVANPGGEGTPVGVWLNADVGQQAAPSKSGRQQVKAGGKGTQGGSGSLAFRPGWHLGDIPRASQFDRKNPETGKKELFPANFVWAECEYAADVDYQDEAMSYGYTENGKFRHAYAGLPRLPENGYYRYRTNPKPDTVPWIITGAMRVTRILTDAETDAICRENGVEPAARQGGPMTAERMEKELGIKAGDTVETAQQRFSIGGRMAQTAEMEKFRQARKMDANDVDAETIRKETGWFRGPDEHWRFEINDQGASFDPDGDVRGKLTYLNLQERRRRMNNFLNDKFKEDSPVWTVLDEIDLETENETDLETIKGQIASIVNRSNLMDSLKEYLQGYAEVDAEYNKLGKTIHGYTDAMNRTLADYLDHPDLFRAYPQLRDIPLEFDSSLGRNTKGAFGYRNGERTIVLNPNAFDTDDGIMDTLTHEIQHAVQDIEGFASGASPEYWAGQLMFGATVRTKGEQNEIDRLRNELSQAMSDNPEMVEEAITLNQSVPKIPRGEINWDTLEQIEEDPPEWQEFDRRRDELEEQYGQPFMDVLWLLGSIEQAEKGKSRSADDLYWMTAGEVEAREVSARRKMSDEERRKNPPKLGGDDVVFANGARYSISAQTESPEFKQWFGDWQNDPAHASKVVNEDGTPKVVYHQTGEDFTIFDPRHKGAGTSDNGTPFGIFLKSNDSNIGLRGGKQMALYANIRNPLAATNREDLARQARKMSPEYSELLDQLNALDKEYHAKHEAAKQALSDFMSEWRKENPNAGRRALWDVPQFTELFDAEDVVVEEWGEKASELSQQAKETLTRALRENGYDGVILREDSGSFGRRTDAFIALDAEQVKSATDNAGTFDRGNPDIRFSITPQADADYMAAVKSGDMETAQRMVDEAAKAAGYTGKWAHGTPTASFTSFDLGKARGAKAVFLSDPGTAAQYANTTYRPVKTRLINKEITNIEDALSEYKRIYSAMQQPVKVADGKYKIGRKELTEAELIGRLNRNLKVDKRIRGGVYYLYVKEGKKYTVDAKDKWWNEISDPHGKTTDAIGIWARKAGYDSLEIDNVVDGGFGFVPSDILLVFDENSMKSSDPVTYDDNGNVIPLSERFNAETGDIRYSLGTEGYDRARLMRENQELKEKLDYWRGQVKKSDRTKADPKEVKKLAGKLRTDFSTDMDADEITQRLQAIYDGIGKDWSYDRAYEEAGKLARDMIEQATATEDYLYAEYAPMRKFFQDTPLVVTPELKRAIPDYNEWRKARFGKLRLQSGDQTNIDQVFQEAAEKWPEWFSEEVSANSLDQLERIAEVMGGIYSRDEVNPFGDDIAGPAGYLTTQIMDAFWDVPSIKKTFADRAEARLGREVARRLDMKERYENALQKVREQRDRKLKEQSERYLTAKRKRSQKQKERELRAKIVRHCSRLSTKLTRPTDTQHIPEALVDTVRTALESINLASKDMKDTKRTQAFAALQKMYQEMDTNGSEVVIDPDLLPNISDIIGFADTPIANLGMEDLNTIWQTVRAIEASISTFNKALGRAKFETISQPAFGIRDYLIGRKDRGDYRGPFRQMDKLLNFNMLTPEAYFLRMGNSGKEVFRMLRDAQDRHITIMDQAQRKTREIIGKTDIRKLEKEKHTFTFDGETVELTTAQIMSLYELMKRQQAVDHVMIGGIRPESVKKGIKDLPPARPWHLTQDQVSEVVDALTPEQVKLADELQKYMGGTMAELGNEASMEVYGYRKFTEKHYFPISVDKNQTQSDVKNDAVSGTIAGWGSARPVKPNANNAVILRSIFDVYADHVTEMANYASWLAPMENMNRIFNFRYKDEQGNQTGTMKDQLETLFGKNGEAYWKQLQEDLNNGVHGRDDSPFSAFMGTYKASAIGANIRVIAQQPTAILRALDSINPADFVAGMAKARIGKFDKVVKQYAPIAIWKDWGYFQQDTGRQMRNVLFNDDTMLQRANSAMMWGAGKADSISWTAIWNALESETRRKRKDLRYKSREFYEAVAERFNEVVDHTQVVDGILQRSQIMRSADGLTKMATSFMAEPTKTYNMMLSAIYEARNAKGRERSAAMGKLAKTAFALTVSITVNAAAQSLVDAIRDDDKDEEYWEKFIQAYFGLEGETRKEQIKNGILNGNLEAAFNPLTYIPYLKDIISQTQGYTVSRMDMDTISRVLKAFQNVEKAMSGEGKNTRQSAWLNLTAEVARFLGIPAANIKRDIQTISRTFFAGTGNYRMLYKQEKFLYDVTSTNTLTEFSKLILGAEWAGDEEAAQAIRQDMIDSGVDAEKLDKKLAELRKKAVTDTEEYQTALAQKTDAYQTMLEASPQYQEMDEELQGKVQDKLDSYAQYQVLGQSMEVDGSDFEKVQAAEASGVPAVDWAVLTVLKGSRNNYEENGKTIKVQDQMIETIDQMGGTDEEKSARYRTLYDSDKNNPWVKK